MVSLLNSSCARFDDVPRSVARYELEAAVLYMKGTWLPSEFSISICDGNDAWIGRASEDFVVANASILGLTDSEYVDTVQFCFSKQQPDVKYELKWAKNLSPELICYKDSKLVLRLQTTTDSGPRVAADMVQLLLEAHHGLTEELARKTRGFARDIAAKDRILKSLQNQLEEVLPVTNGHVNVVVGDEDAGVKTVPGTSSRAKRKGGATNAETGSRKRPAKTSEALPLFQKSASPVPLLMEPATTTRPPALSALGYKQQLQPKVWEEHETSKDLSWLEAGHTKERSNGVTDNSYSEAHIGGGKKAILDLLSDVAELKTDHVIGMKAIKKKQGKSRGKKLRGKKSSKKVQPQPSLEDSLNQNVAGESHSTTIIHQLQKLRSYGVMKAQGGMDATMKRDGDYRSEKKSGKAWYNISQRAMVDYLWKGEITIKMNEFALALKKKGVAVDKFGEEWRTMEAAVIRERVRRLEKLTPICNPANGELFWKKLLELAKEQMGYLNIVKVNLISVAKVDGNEKARWLELWMDKSIMRTAGGFPSSFDMRGNDSLEVFVARATLIHQLKDALVSTVARLEANKSITYVDNKKPEITPDAYMVDIREAYFRDLFCLDFPSDKNVKFKKEEKDRDGWKKIVDHDFIHRSHCWEDQGHSKMLLNRALFRYIKFILLESNLIVSEPAICTVLSGAVGDEMWTDAHRRKWHPLHLKAGGWYLDLPNIPDSEKALHNQVELEVQAAKWAAEARL